MEGVRGEYGGSTRGVWREYEGSMKGVRGQYEVSMIRARIILGKTLEKPGHKLWICMSSVEVLYDTYTVHLVLWHTKYPRNIDIRNNLCNIVTSSYNNI
jgi:hypothetical protein